MDLPSIDSSPTGNVDTAPTSTYTTGGPRPTKPATVNLQIKLFPDLARFLIKYVSQRSHDISREYVLNVPCFICVR